MISAQSRWLAVPLLAVAGCAAPDEEPAGWVQPAFVHYNVTYGSAYYDGYDDGFFYGGPGYWPGYYYPSHDYWARRHFRRHHRPDGGFVFSPQRGVTCDPRTHVCFGEDGPDSDWTDTVFGDTGRHEARSGSDDRSGAILRPVRPQGEAPEDAPQANMLDEVQPMRPPSRSAPDPLVAPQPGQQEQPQLRPMRPDVGRSGVPTIMVPQSCIGAACR